MKIFQLLHDDLDQEKNTEVLLLNIEEEISLGKSELAHIKIQDWRVSGLHALIRKVNDYDFVIVDLGSSYGTKINHEVIKEKVIDDGDLLSIGNQHFVFRKDANQKQSHWRESWPYPAHPKGPEADSQNEDLVSERTLLQVSLLWGDQLIEVKTFSEGQLITIGNPRLATFAVNLGSLKWDGTPFTIAEYQSGKLRLNIPGEAHGLIWIDQKVYAVDSLRFYQNASGMDKDINVNSNKTMTTDAFSTSLRVGDYAHLEMGELSLNFSFVKPVKKLAASILPKWDRTFQKILGSIVFLYGMLFIFFMQAKVEEDPEKLKTLEHIPEKLKKIVYEIGIEKAKKKRIAAIGAFITSEGGRARSEEGESSPKKAPKTVDIAKVSEKKVEKDRPKKESVDQAKSPAKSKSEIMDDAFQPMAKTTNLDSQAMPSKNLKNGNSTTALNTQGYAYGRAGTGEGGGGHSVGIGDRKGYAVGGGMGAYDYGTIPSKGKQNIEIEIPSSNEIIVMDGLDPDIIAAIIKRYLPQIQHCYEQGLSRDPKIKGKVTMDFIIKGDGSVGKVKVHDSDLKDPMTEECMMEKIKTWKFPQPKGGGTVGVKYPFIFMSNSGNL